MDGFDFIEMCSDDVSTNEIENIENDLYKIFAKYFQ